MLKDRIDSGMDHLFENAKICRSRTGPGRPTKLTPECQAILVELIRNGSPSEAASAIAGISAGTFYYWMETGLADLSDNKHSKYSEFFEAISRARHELETQMANKWLKISTEPQSKVKRVYKEQLVTDPVTGSTDVVRYLDSETTEINGDGDWRGIAEFMARRWPERWKRVESVEQSGPNGGPIEFKS